ncbi:hypothetical protein EV360DRAFT_74149 [Lentinula raphanica]|nr:hypothetical protein EV360DRAFT_74149 [Lentinula raphanica]
MPNANLPSASSNSSTLSSSTGDTMLLTPDLSSSSNVPVHFVKCNPLTGFRVTSILAPPTEPASPVITKPKGPKPKKMDEAMVADPASMARNLFAIDYLKNNTCTKSEFKDAWNVLGSLGQKHWNSLSKELKKGKKNNGNNKVHIVILMTDYQLFRILKDLNALQVLLAAIGINPVQTVQYHIYTSKTKKSWWIWAYNILKVDKIWDSESLPGTKQEALNGLALSQVPGLTHKPVQINLVNHQALLCYSVDALVKNYSMRWTMPKSIIGSQQDWQ